MVIDEDALGFLVGFLLAIIVVNIFGRIKRRNGDKAYDERQILVRGKGYRYAFFTLIFFNLIYEVVYADNQSIIARYMDGQITLFIGICLAIGVYVGYCIWNDGYFPPGQRPKCFVILYMIIVIVNLIVGIVDWKSCFTDGVLNFQAVNIVCSILLLFIGLVLLLKYIKDRNMLADEEDEE